ncbi:MAG: hypothetical protein RSA52_04105 [Acetivibrio sp.]
MKKWTETEEQSLRRACARNLDVTQLRCWQSHGEASVKDKMLELGVHAAKQANRKRWGVQDTTFLMEHLKEMTYQEIGDALHRSRGSVYREALQLGLPEVRERSGRWSAKEIAILTKNWGTMGKKVQKKLPGRTLSAIYSQVGLQKLGNPTHHWTEEEDQILIQYWTKERKVAKEKLKKYKIESVYGRVHLLRKRGLL